MNWIRRKKLSNRKLLLGTLIVSTFFLFVLIYFWTVLPTKSSPLAVTESIKLLPRVAVIEPESLIFSLPSRIEIPVINVIATVTPVGLTPQGAMDIPADQDEVVWFEPGSRPGEIGSAVLAGHYGLKRGRGSIFDNLHKLRPGDKIYIEDEQGLKLTYVVKESRRYNPNDSAAEVFSSQDDKAHLNLITCEGEWSEDVQSFSKRLVVFTELETDLN